MELSCRKLISTGRTALFERRWRPHCEISFGLEAEPQLVIAFKALEALDKTLAFPPLLTLFRKAH